MLFADITYIDEHFHAVEHAWIGVRGARIDYVGGAPPADGQEYGRRYDGRGKLLVNGLFNLHSHTAMTLLRGYGENLPLHEWLEQRIFPFEAHLDYHDIYWGTLLGAAEMLRFGIVATTDMYMNGAALGDAFAAAGVKANFCVGVTCADDRSYREMPQYAETLRMIEKYHNREDGRLRVDFCLHAEYTSTEKLARSLAEAALEHGLGMHVHVGETAFETAGCHERRGGRTPTRYLADCGLFDAPTTAAHCVHVTEEDIAILAEKGVAVATCPRSNLKLASGVAPATKMLAAGVNVALGTDSVSSNNNLDFFEEMRVFSLLQKNAAHDATAISPAQALAAATAAGARAQRRADCGAIKPGNRADLVVLDLSQPHMHPQHDVLCNLVFSACGSDVVLTMVDGVVRYENNDWPQLDIEKIYAETDGSIRRIITALNA